MKVESGVKRSRGRNRMKDETKGSGRRERVKDGGTENVEDRGRKR